MTNATGAKIESNKDFVTYNAGVTFKPTENGSIYASYATSANPVGVDGGDGSESIGQAYMDLKPEESQTIELGTKWNVLNEKLNLTAAIFRTEKQNTRIQVDSSTYTNGGDSKVDGIELSANGNITDKWAVSAGYTYLDSENTDQGQVVVVLVYVIQKMQLRVSNFQTYLKTLQLYGLHIKYCLNLLWVLALSMLTKYMVMQLIQNGFLHMFDMMQWLVITLTRMLTCNLT